MITLRGLKEALFTYITSGAILALFWVFWLWYNPDDVGCKFAVSALLILYSIGYLDEVNLHKEAIKGWEETINFNGQLIEKLKDLRNENQNLRIERTATEIPTFNPARRDDLSPSTKGTSYGVCKDVGENIL